MPEALSDLFAESGVRGMFPANIAEAAALLVALLRDKQLKVTTAESCTGGLVAGAITSIAGSSEIFEQGFVTYADSAKSSMIGVPAGLIAAHGAVSAEVCRAMALDALAAANAGISVAITGIAGPGGGSQEKPVGLVYIATASRKSSPQVRRHTFGDIGRNEVRMASVGEALAMLIEEANR